MTKEFLEEMKQSLLTVYIALDKKLVDKEGNQISFFKLK